MDYYDRESYCRSVKIYAPGRRLADVYHGLLEFVEPRHIASIGKVDSNTFMVTVPDREAFYILLEAGSVEVGGRFQRIVRVSKQELRVKVHWLPDYIADDFLSTFFGRFGEVTAVHRDTQIVSGETRATVRNCVRTVVLKTGEMGIGEIPHMVKFDGGITILLTLPGRDPLCLKCHQVGHMRRTCPSNPATRTWADVAQSQPRPGPATPSHARDGEEERRPPPARDVTPTPTDDVAPTVDRTGPKPREPAPSGSAADDADDTLVIDEDAATPGEPSPRDVAGTPTGDAADEGMDLLTPGQRHPDRTDDPAMETTSANAKRRHDEDDDVGMTHVMKQGKSVRI
ncbi:MAG: hypothetical protein ABW185_17475 [Sedimenticola sp.]